MEKQDPHAFDNFEEVLDKEFSVFKLGEKYDYVKDVKDAFQDSLSKSAAQRIFETIPDHVFWDIKKPLNPDKEVAMNPYNPFRMYPNTSFFEMRDYEEYMNRRTRKENLRDAVSTYRRY